ncbi:unnamed protein product, partial [Ixodes pacificus]
LRLGFTLSHTLCHRHSRSIPSFPAPATHHWKHGRRCFESGCTERANGAKEHGGNRAAASQNPSFSSNHKRPNERRRHAPGQ